MPSPARTAVKPPSSPALPACAVAAAGPATVVDVAAAPLPLRLALPLAPLALPLLAPMCFALLMHHVPSLSLPSRPDAVSSMSSTMYTTARPSTGCQLGRSATSQSMALALFEPRTCRSCKNSWQPCWRGLAAELPRCSMDAMLRGDPARDPVLQPRAVHACNVCHSFVSCCGGAVSCVPLHVVMCDSACV